MLFRNKISKMYTSMKKIQRDKEVEKSVAQALFELKNTHQELKSELKDLLYIKSANQIDVSGNRKAVVIRFPYRLRKPFRKIHDKLVRELEKKRSGKDVVFIATKRIVRPRKKSFSAHVRIAILEDIVHPAKITAIKGSYRPDGSPIITIMLDPKARNETLHKLKTFRRVYWKVWGRNVYFKYSDTSMKKIQKDKGGTPTMFEESVAKALFDLESTHQELKNDLKDLYIKSAVEIYVSRKRKAVVIHVPYALRKQFRKIHTKLVTELGKKLWAKDVIFIATREKGFADQRRTRRAMLKDIVYPAEILGSEILGRGAGERFFLDAKDLNDRECEECKLQTFCRVYWELTGEILNIEYRVGDTECI